MQVLIREEVRNIQVTTVILTHDYGPMGDMKLKMFHCYQCRNKLFQYKGNVQSIIPGDTAIPLPVLIKCPTLDCGKVYSVQAIT